jgi:hypothetical protein
MSARATARVWLGCLLALSLAGCTQSVYRMGGELPPAFAVQPGTPLSSVLGELGPPLRVSSTPQGWVMAWEHWRVAEASLGLSLGLVGADLLSLDWGDARVRGDFLLLGFDRQHRLTDSARVAWDNDVGDGSAVLPLIGGVPVVSVADLLLPLPYHAWGGASLLPLPTALNNAQRPDMGTTGIEQRGTPSALGQRALELN